MVASGALSTRQAPFVNPIVNGHLFEKMPHKKPLVRSVPLELIWTGYHWETMRESYFRKHNQIQQADQAHQLRLLYKQRLWEECGVEVKL